MVSLEYTYKKNDQEKKDYYNGILKENSTPVTLTEGNRYTMRCTLTTAVFEQCTINPFE